MTLVLDSPFTGSQQKYQMSFDNQQIMSAVSHVYRIIDGEEIDVTTTEPKLIQTSDDNYQIILKFEGPTSLTRYGLNIVYDVESF